MIIQIIRKINKIINGLLINFLINLLSKMLIRIFKKPKNKYTANAPLIVVILLILKKIVRLMQRIFLNKDQ